MAELLAPAGNLEALDAAIGEGADAVYLGLKSFNARLRTTNFAWNQFEAAVQAVHRLGKKIFVTVNTVMEECETERMYRFLSYLDKIGPDGLIVQDFGVVRMVQQFFPRLRLHGSTQMNVASAKAANVMSRSGLKRVVVARELSLAEIKQIKERTNVEIETFVHGALCVSESGLCLFSSYLGGKSANRGMCTQACRRLYEADTASGSQEGFYFSPHDLQLVDFIPDLISAGVDSFKIEGRMKSAEYVGSVVAAYRYLMDHWQEDKKGSIATAKRLLSTDFARSKTAYWFTSCNAENVLNPNQASGTGIFLGKITQVKSMRPGFADDADGKDESIDDANDNIIEENAQNFSDKNSSAQNALLQNAPAQSATTHNSTLQSATTTNALQTNASAYNAPKARYAIIKGGTYVPEVGDSIRLHKKDDTGRVSHKIKSLFEDGDKTWVEIPNGFGVGDSVYLIQTKSMSKRYRHVLPNDISRFKSQPGAEELPILDLTPLNKEDLDFFPEGLYIQVSTIKDLYAIQAEKPVRAILELNSETKVALLQKREALPFSKKQMIISLDPFAPQAIEDELSKSIDELVACGFEVFVVNNPMHIAAVKSAKGKMIAGPYLYSFNRWAASWLENQDIVPLITPLENSKRNLEETFDLQQRKRVMVSIFAYPALFRMRFALPESYDFLYFADRQEGIFKALSTKDGSFVMPEAPFSLLDKAEQLRMSGFTHLLVDMSKTAVKKSDFKYIMQAYHSGKVLQDTSRFNWKDGFYSPEKIENFKAMNEARRLQEEAMYAHKKRFGTGGKGRANTFEYANASTRASAVNRTNAKGRPARKNGANANASTRTKRSTHTNARNSNTNARGKRR